MKSSAPAFSTKQKEETTVKYHFDASISKEVLCAYLRRSVTISLERENSASPKDTHILSFLLNTGAKYICRAATCWDPSGKDLATHAGQKEFLSLAHGQDETIVFEACIFECISHGANEIPIPAHVFEAFGLKPEERCFDFDLMRYEDGTFLNQWGMGTAVPDITKIETQLFFYCRACAYIDLGYEALHMGQVHLIGARDNDWRCWTRLLDLIRAYAAKHARRHFVFLNAHTHGIVGSDGKLLFDFHMYPSRPMAIGEAAHAPSEESPQECIFSQEHADSIYGKSLGGMTHSGWECDSLPYLVELDNYDNDPDLINHPDSGDWRCWGMDEITWYANQPAAYRKAFLEYAFDWVTKASNGNSFFAMPGQRIATLFDKSMHPYAQQYRAYLPPQGCGDEAFIKEIWAKNCR
jgi:hypothetical protein